MPFVQKAKPRWAYQLRRFAVLVAAVPFCVPLSSAQTSTPSNQSPASVPAGADSATTMLPSDVIVAPQDLPPKQLRAAEEAYLHGARALDRKDMLTAERDFTRAAQLNPHNREYAIALAVTREHRLTELVQKAATARRLGHDAQADQLLEEARALDPDNAVVRQHFSPDGKPTAFDTTAFSPAEAAQTQRAVDVSGLAGPVQFTPEPGLHSFHTRGDAQTVLRTVYTAFGLKCELDSSVGGEQIGRFDLENADFATAARVAGALTHTFAVPLQPKVAFLAKNTTENRAQFQPLVEETLYIPGTTPEALTEYATLARNIFDLKGVNAVASSGSLVLRGDEDTLSRVNATFADLVDGGADVLLDVTLYEVDKSRMNNVGASLPSSVGVFPIAAEAQSLIAANQSLLSQAIANNLITITGNAYTDALTELGFLLASGVISSTQFTNLLGVFGHYAGLPLAGVFLGSGTTLNALLNTSDVRLLDNVQLRAGNHADASFRAGTRYPIETGIYSSSLSSGLASSVAGLSINGTSVSSLLSQYLGSASASVPQIQFEDLGLTLKATPEVLRADDVLLKLDLKIEALGSGTINTLPILNNRQLTSTITVPVGDTALLASFVSRNEQRSITGLPFLSELPGFGATDKSTEVDTTELLITLTPHVVRRKGVQITGRRLLLANGSSAPQP